MVLKVFRWAPGARERLAGVRDPRPGGDDGAGRPRRRPAAPRPDARLPLRVPRRHVRLLRHGHRRARAVGVPDAAAQPGERAGDRAPALSLPADPRPRRGHGAVQGEDGRSGRGLRPGRGAGRVRASRRRQPRAPAHRWGHRVHRLRHVRLRLHHGRPRCALRRARRVQPGVHASGGQPRRRAWRSGRRASSRKTRSSAATARAIAPRSAPWRSRRPTPSWPCAVARSRGSSADARRAARDLDNGVEAGRARPREATARSARHDAVPVLPRGRAAISPPTSCTRTR